MRSSIGGQARALERLGRNVRADEAGNDDSRGNAKLLVGEIDCLDGLLALELLDLEWMAIETVYEGHSDSLRATDALSESERLVHT